MPPNRISLGCRPRGCRNVRILGVCPNLDDYDPSSRDLITRSRRVLYPTRLYAQPLTDAGKTVFPSGRHYFYLGDKIRQTTLYGALGLAMPRTRVFYGRQRQNVLRHFSFPFIAKIPIGLGGGRGVFLIRRESEWRTYLQRTRVAYVQEYLPLERDLRVVAVAGRLVAAYWRVARPDEFRTNLGQGGRIELSDLSGEGVDFALKAARRCGFDDVGLDVCQYRGRWMILEANMHYGLAGLRAAGIRLADVLDGLIEEGVI